MIRRVRRRIWLLYPAWIVFCALLFVALRGVDDPSRRHDRIASTDAAALALAALKTTNGTPFAVVHVAYAPRGETGGRARWIVLCDHVPHTALRGALVVELDAQDGKVLLIRSPVR